MFQEVTREGENRLNLKETVDNGRYGTLLNFLTLLENNSERLSKREVKVRGQKVTEDNDNWARGVSQLLHAMCLRGVVSSERETVECRLYFIL